MSAMKSPRERNSASQDKQVISTTRLRAARHLKFFHAEDGALTAVEFEMMPSSSVLHPVYRALANHRVSIVDTSARITPNSMYQRFELCELTGQALVGERRHEVEALFLEILSLDSIDTE